MGVKIFFIGKSLDNAQSSTVIFEGPENVLYDIFMNPKQNLYLKLQDIFMRNKNHSLDFLKKKLL